MDQERADYADNDLPPPMRWADVAGPLSAVATAIGIVVVAFLFVMLAATRLHP